MQKVIRRTELVKSQTKRKARIRDELKHKQELVTYRSALTRFNRTAAVPIREERLRRHQNWDMGSLSPWRQKSPNELLQGGAGVYTTEAALGQPSLPSRDRPKDWMIREGDKVCIVEGHESVKGRVGKVTAIDVEKCSFVIEGLNRVDVETPRNTRALGEEAMRTTELPVPYANVRLVYPLPDPITGVPRDCILTTLVARNHRFDRFENEHTFDRWLEPQHLRIPWPDKKPPAFRDEEADTLRIDSEEQTFLPTLLRPPMPMGIIDELRNRYSKFRDRHEDEWLEKKKAEDEAVEREKTRMWSLMPRSARNIARLGQARGPVSGMKQDKGERPGSRLSERHAEGIGAHMRERGMKLTDARDVAVRVAS